MRAWWQVRRGKVWLGRKIAEAEWRAAASLWSRHGAGEGVVVDWGAGNGDFWRFARRPERLMLIDIRRQGRWVGIAGCRVIADATRPPLATGSVTGMVALGVAEYLPDLVGTLREWRRVARAGAVLVVSNSPPIAPNRWRERLDRSVRVRPDEVMRSALNAAGWRLRGESLLRAGWQTLFVAEAV